MTMRALAGTAGLAAVLALSGTAWAAPSPFSGSTVFGDSLSDAGNLSILSGDPSLMRFTTNPGLTAGEDVAGYYGLPLTASLHGGSDFAYGGAGVNTNAPFTPAAVPTVTQQIDSYLAATPKVDPSRLYTVFAGANDIFYNATSAAASQIADSIIARIPASTPAATRATQVHSIDNLVEGVAGVSTLESSADAFTNVAQAASQELTLISALQKAGARYILVFSLPDIGRTPEAAADEAIAPGAAAALTTLSKGFNTVLDGGLSTLKVGIIPINTYALLNEILANPTAYGFSNSTTPACTTASSVMCTPATLRAPDAAQTYLFADGVHPTTATHALFAQYIEAEIAAPQQISLLAEAPLATLDSERSAVNTQLLDDQVSGLTGVRLFATGGYAYSHVGGERFTPSARDDAGLLTAGVDWRPDAQVSLGAELTGGGGGERLDGQLRRFDTTTILGSLFGQYIWRQHAYVNGAVGFGSLQFDGIQRSFKLGTAVRVENGSTGGSTVLAAVETGYVFTPLPRLRTGPFVGGTYEHVRVDAYGEGGGDSSAMTFADQSREALVGRAGWRAQGDLPTAWGALQPYVQVDYAYDGDARTRDVIAGLVSMPGQFAIPGFSPDRQWGEVQAGVNAHVGPHWTAYAAYQGRFAGGVTDEDSADLGVSYAF